MIPAVLRRLPDLEEGPVARNCRSRSVAPSDSRYAISRVAPQGLLTVTVLAALLLTGCSAGPPVTPTTTAPEGRGEITKSTRWTAASAEHHAAFHQAYLLATERLDEVAEGREPGTWAVVVDADETVIDNVAYQVWLDRSGNRFAAGTWREWVRREEAPPLPGAIPFLRRIRELGGTIAIVSNRSERVRKATEENFRRYGIPWDLMLLQTDEGSKESRWEAIEEGTASPDFPPLQILLWVGDNIRDFPGASQSDRFRKAEAFREFGRRFIVLPNPTYGSWEQNPVSRHFVP